MSAELLITLELDIIEDALRNHGDENGVNLDGILDKVLALNEWFSTLPVQLLAVTRERDAYRKWAEAMPALPASGVLRVGDLPAIEEWMRQRPGDSDADGLYMDV